MKKPDRDQKPANDKTAVKALPVVQLPHVSGGQPGRTNNFNHNSTRLCLR